MVKEIRKVEIEAWQRWTRLNNSPQFYDNIYGCFFKETCLSSSIFTEMDV
jgi:hypothetical protein